MSATFITATGTDIGKTFVAAGLIRYFRKAGQSIHALKPVATGFDQSAAASSDPGVLLTALDQHIDEPALKAISPWRFAAPLSPDMAAQREGRAIDFEALVAFCQSIIGRSEGRLLIEGIGGVMVPLDEQRTVIDWVAALKIPALLVAGSYLGSLSHTLTALDTLRRRDCAVRAIVVNETPGSTVPLAETIVTLTHFTAPIPVVALPRRPEQHDEAFASIAALM